MRCLLLLCLLAAVRPAGAREPIRFDLPYTLENGKYVVTLDSPAGSGRFLFDTGASCTVVSESLCRRLGLKTEKYGLVGDYQGNRDSVAYVRIPHLKMGEAEFFDKQVIVLPDSSYIFRCLGFDGIAGSDLLQEFVVRMPNADSTITLTSDIRQLGKLDKRHSSRFWFHLGRPLVRLGLQGGDRRYACYMLFDTGSSAFCDIRYQDCLVLRDRGIARNMRHVEGYPESVGWTNRTEVGSICRGIAPVCELAGGRLEEVPFGTTHGGVSKLGCGIFAWGTVVLDYPGRRIWLLPHPEPPVVDRSCRNIGSSVKEGRLVVGQVWDEALEDVVAPGDRIVRVGDMSVENSDICDIMRLDVRSKISDITVERLDGDLVTVRIKTL